MSAVNDGGPAFPALRENNNPAMPLIMASAGMSLRDWFAGQAIGELIASDGVEAQLKSGMIRIEELPDFLAPIAYNVADAMLRAREAKQ